MRLSALQRFILTDSADVRTARVPRKRFRAFYRRHPSAPSNEDQQNAITKSLERLIDNGFLVGYGRRTPEKWYIDDVRLTPQGRRVARTLFGTQQALPLKSKFKMNNSK